MTAAAARAPLTFPRRESISDRPIIGTSQGLRNAWDAVQLVAPTDAAVWIHGETGTGKELIARGIHENSRRKHGPYVKLNCAAIPAGLLESELFGHERGAFTGALAQTTGRFQMANQGTLFLDEIGDLPLELQPKLLRVLQEQEFERLGSARTIHIDVRIVTATNLDLAKLVREKRFRADLYYRLNVFPITMPALRDRTGDIPELVHHFTQIFARRMNKTIDVIPDHVMDLLRSYDWPGNVRELQNFIERAVILTSGSVLRPPLEELRAFAKVDEPGNTRTLAEAEREHIVDVLRQSGGVVGGREGAAARLGLARTTLLYRMRKLGIGSEQPAYGVA
jgi:formate hydrogenlyase transcriptional activator